MIHNTQSSFQENAWWVVRHFVALPHWLECTTDSEIPQSRTLCWSMIVFPMTRWALTHWDRVTQICVGKLIIIGSDNGLSPARHQPIIWTNAGIFLIGTLGTNFSEIWIGIQTFSFTKLHLKMSSAKWRPFCFGLNVLSADTLECHIQWYATFSLHTVHIF